MSSCRESCRATIGSSKTVIRKLAHDEIAADLATVDSILQSIPDDDVLGRVGFEARRDRLARSLLELEALPEAHARADDPVKGGNDDDPTGFGDLKP